MSTVETSLAVPLLSGSAMRHRAATWLFEAIVRGDLPTGSRLILLMLALLIGVSVVPIREALVTLESPGSSSSGPTAGRRSSRTGLLSSASSTKSWPSWRWPPAVGPVDASIGGSCYSSRTRCLIFSVAPTTRRGPKRSWHWTGDWTRRSSAPAAADSWAGNLAGTMNCCLPSAKSLLAKTFDSVVVVPREAEEQAIGLALQKVNTEGEVRRAIKGGMKATEAWNNYGVL